MDMQVMIEQEKADHQQYEATTVVTEQGETIAFLRLLFDAVCEADWKKPITARSHHSMVGPICRAIEFFQGDKPEVSGPEAYSGWLIITSRGYQG